MTTWVPKDVEEEQVGEGRGDGRDPHPLTWERKRSRVVFVTIVKGGFFSVQFYLDYVEKQSRFLLSLNDIDLLEPLDPQLSRGIPWSTASEV